MIKLFTRENVFTVISLFIAVIFAWGFFVKAGFPPTRAAGNWQLLTVFVIFVILPFAKKLDVFQFLTFEAKIDEVRREVDNASKKVTDVKDDLRHLISLQNNLANTVRVMSTQSNTFNLGYPGQPKEDEVDAATRSLSDVNPDASAAAGFSKSLSDEEILKAIMAGSDGKQRTEKKESLSSLFQDFEQINAVRKLRLSEHVGILRIRVERELRRLVDGLKVYPTPRNARSLVQIVMKYYADQLADQYRSFDVFFRIANAAVHGEDVPTEDLDVATNLGERLVALLNGIQATNDDLPGSDQMPGE